jgi:hypothetical protein
MDSFPAGNYRVLIIFRLLLLDVFLIASGTVDSERHRLHATQIFAYPKDFTILKIALQDPKVNTFYRVAVNERSSTLALRPGAKIAAI